MEEKEFLKKMGIEVRVARLRKDLTIKEVSKLSGLGLNCIVDTENGHRNTGIIVLKRIADTLGVSVADFFIFVK